MAVQSMLMKIAVTNVVIKTLFIIEEKYKLAKQLKDCIDELQQVECSDGSSVSRELCCN